MNVVWLCRQTHSRRGQATAHVGLCLQHCPRAICVNELCVLVLCVLTSASCCNLRTLPGRGRKSVAWVLAQSEMAHEAVLSATLCKHTKVPLQQYLAQYCSATATAPLATAALAERPDNQSLQCSCARHELETEWFPTHKKRRKGRLTRSNFGDDCTHSCPFVKLAVTS